MAFKKKIKEVEAVEEVKPELVAEKVEVAVPKNAKPIVLEATGKFYASKIGDSYVVVNGVGQVVSKAMTQTKAEDMAIKFNR